jgi:hypothetical protein
MLRIGMRLVGFAYGVLGTVFFVLFVLFVDDAFIMLLRRNIY